MADPQVVASEAERWHRFGRFVETYRRDHTDYSQKQAALKAGMTRQQWNRIEKGTSGSKRSTIIRIAEILGADPVLFLEQAGFQEPGVFAGVSDSPANSLDEMALRRLARYYGELPEECKLDFMALAESLWRRRRAEGRIERAAKRDGGKHRPQTVQPAPPRKAQKRKAG